MAWASFPKCQVNIPYVSKNLPAHIPPLHMCLIQMFPGEPLATFQSKKNGKRELLSELQEAKPETL